MNETLNETLISQGSDQPWRSTHGDVVQLGVYVMAQPRGRPARAQHHQARPAAGHDMAGRGGGSGDRRWLRRACCVASNAEGREPAAHCGGVLTPCPEAGSLASTARARCAPAAARQPLGTAAAAAAGREPADAPQDCCCCCCPAATAPAAAPWRPILPAKTAAAKLSAAVTEGGRCSASAGTGACWFSSRRDLAAVGLAAAFLQLLASFREQRDCCAIFS